VVDIDAAFEEYFRYVYLYMRKLTHDEALAEEITSEAFFKALAAIDRFKGDCDIRVWLCQIAKNCYFSHLKKAHKEGPIESIDDIRSDHLVPNPADMLIEKESVGEIHKILHRLNEPYKEVFMLRVFGELSFGQIGELFNKTANWACVTYHRARKMIQERLEDKR